MGRSGAFLRWVPARLFALLLTVGVASVGVWWSTTVATKAAGLYRDVELTVINKASHSVRVSMCDGLYGPCPEFNNYEVAPGKRAWRTHETVYGTVFYYTQGPGWYVTYSFYFKAANPAAAPPYLEVTPKIVSSGHPAQTFARRRWDLSEGQTIGPENVAYFHIALHRATDTSRVKVMSITITKVPNS